MDEGFLMEAFSFQQSMHNDLKDRRWDICAGDELLNKMDFIFEKCYGSKYKEDDQLSKKALSIVEKFLSVAKIFENHWKFNVSFIYCQLKKNLSCVNFLLWTVTEDDADCIIDENCRVYKSFNEFLNNNVLPKCFMIFPKEGMYKGNSCVQLDCSWSIACSNTAMVKSVLDVVAPLSMLVSGAMVSSTPLGLPVWIASSFYELFRGGEKLMDINEYEGGISLENKNALLASVDITLTTASILTFGASCIIKKIANGANIMKVLNFMEKSYKYTCTAGTMVCFLILVEKHREGTLCPQDLITVAKCLLFSSNCFINTETFQNVVAYLGTVSLRKIVNCISNITNSYSEIKAVMRYTRPSEWLKFINDFFPSLVPDISIPPELNRIMGNVSEIVRLIEQMMKNKNPISTVNILKLINRLKLVYDDVGQCFTSKYNELAQYLEVEYWDKICKWNEARCSNVEQKILTARDIKTTLENFANLLQLNEKKKFYLLMLSLTDDENLKDDTEALQRLVFYCTMFMEEFNSLITGCVYETLRETANLVYNNKQYTKPDNNEERLVSDCFKQAADNLIDKKEFYHRKLVEVQEKEFENDSKCLNCPVYSFNWPINGELSEKVFYDIASSIIEFTVNKNNSHNMYGDNLSIIYLTQDNSMLIFFYEIVNGHVKGVMLHTNK